MGIKVGTPRVDMSGVKAKIDRLKSNAALGMFAVEECARIAQPYVPEREGILKDATGASEPWLLVYDTPYAHYQFMGVSKGGGSLHYTKSTAMSHWDRAIQARAAEIARALTAKVMTI